MSIRYIGSKARVSEAILGHIGPPEGGAFVDAFSGTGVIALAASKAGWKVHVNDHLKSAAIMSFARVVSSDQTPFDGTSGYVQAIAKLNAIQGAPGFIWREYSPASARHCAVSRMYFKEANAQKIDAIRNRIEEWLQTGVIAEAESCVLIADLMRAANHIANTAGTYGCFLSRWQRQSHAELRLVPRDIPGGAPSATMTAKDVLDVPCGPEDTVYFDPPYTKRQYAAYYHILETIALGDEPQVEGVGGIRPWRDRASDYCYKTRAGTALEALVAACPARRVFLSYSTEAHVPLETLSAALGKIGDVELYELDRIGRYRPNRAASAAGSDVREVLFALKRFR